MINFRNTKIDCFLGKSIKIIGIVVSSAKPSQYYKTCVIITDDLAKQVKTLNYLKIKFNKKTIQLTNNNHIFHQPTDKCF